MNEGGNTALQDNEDRLKELKERAEKLKMDEEAISNEIDKLKNDISKQQVSLVHFLLSNDQSYLRVIFTTGWATGFHYRRRHEILRGVNLSREPFK